jgi:two-component system chemotaxis sensor kinase CheA
MDDLLSEFLTETNESLEIIDTELVKFESNPGDRATLDNIFRLVHTIKGTCGFLGLPRLEHLAHAGETLMGKFRDGALTANPAAVTVILNSIDRIKDILAHLEAEGAEPEGDDHDLIDQLNALSEGKDAVAEPAAVDTAKPLQAGDFDPGLGRALRVGEVSMAELEAAFNAAPAPDFFSDETPTVAAKPSAKAEAKPKAAAKKPEPAKAAAQDDDDGKGEGGVSSNQTIRVSVDVLENLMTMVSELVLTRNQLLQMARTMDDSEFKVPLQRLSAITGELQEGVMKTRMQPMGNAWKKLPRIIRDISLELGKKINLKMEGEATELDRQVSELIKDPLTHMVRNSADHGLEGPEERLAAGKPEVGTVNLRAFHEGGHIIIEIADDGRGLNTDRIREKAIANGVVTAAEAANLSDAQIHKFIFAPGFSTAEVVTSISGRGVGMDVVRTNIEQIGGQIDLVSKEGVGSTFSIKIPLTLAIVSALIVKAGGQRFAIPQLSVLELVRAGHGCEHKLETINGCTVLRLRDRLLPLIDACAITHLTSESADRAARFVVVMAVGASRFGVIVDDVFDTEEIVVKPSSSVLRDIPLYSGNTILGDGSVIMIMDPNGLAETLGRQNTPAEVKDADVVQFATTYNREVINMLVFRAGGEEPKAAPLGLVTRLEEIDASAIECADERHVVQYRGRLMPLVHASGSGHFKTRGKQPVLVFSDRDRVMGLAVDEIVDIVSEHVDVELKANHPGVVGTAVLKGQATEVIDVSYFLVQAFEDWFSRYDEQVFEDKHKVLVVDDSAFFRNMIAPMIVAAGYEVTAVDSPDAAWKLHGDGAMFDIIVSDIEMPGQDGIGFARALAADRKWGQIPRVALSSLPPEVFASKAPDGAFQEFVRKSDRLSLVSVLEHTLKINRSIAA